MTYLQYDKISDWHLIFLYYECDKIKSEYAKRMFYDPNFKKELEEYHALKKGDIHAKED